jgi:hypothetical protein
MTRRRTAAVHDEALNAAARKALQPPAPRLGTREE